MRKKGKKKSKVNKKDIIKLTFLIVIAIVVFSYICYAIFNLIKQPTDTFVVDQGKIYIEENDIGYVIREETIVQGKNYKNGIVQIKAEGEKVSKGEAIFRYYSNGEEELIKKIEELDVKLQEALSNEKDLGLFSTDIPLLEEQIEQRFDVIYNMNDLQKIDKYKNEINTYITRKAKIAGELSPAGSYIRKLIDERAKYEKELNSNSEYINAPESGVLSYRIDNFEDVLTTDDFGKLSKNLLNSLDIKTGQIVETSTESAKIVNNFECYIASIMDSDKAKEAEVGDDVKLQLLNSEEIPAEIAYISTEPDDSRIIVFKITNGVEDLIGYRKITFDVIWWSATGLKVPNSSIVTEGENNYVIRNRAGYLDKILVKVLGKNENYTLIDNYTSQELKDLGLSSEDIANLKKITLYDEILLKPPNDLENV